MIVEPAHVYHANKAVSHSKLETFRRRPRLYFKRFVERSVPPPEETKTFAIGRAVHCSVLEPENFAANFAVSEKFDRRTKEGKAQAEAFETRNAGKTVIDLDQGVLCAKMTSAVREHKLAAQLLSAGRAELSWRANVEPIALQCRTDWFNEAGCELSKGRPYVADLKTVESLDADAFRNFERAVFSYGYHRQAGFYLPLITELFGKPVFDFFFIAVEKQEPFGVAVYRISDDAVACGQDESVADLRAMKRCIDTNVWPNLDEELIELGLPKWYGKGGAS